MIPNPTTHPSERSHIPKTLHDKNDSHPRIFHIHIPKRRNLHCALHFTLLENRTGWRNLTSSQLLQTRQEIHCRPSSKLGWISWISNFYSSSLFYTASIQNKHRQLLVPLFLWGFFTQSRKKTLSASTTVTNPVNLTCRGIRWHRCYIIYKKRTYSKFIENSHSYPFPSIPFISLPIINPSTQSNSYSCVYVQQSFPVQTRTCSQHPSALIHPSPASDIHTQNPTTSRTHISVHHNALLQELVSLSNSRNEASGRGGKGQ